MRLAEGGLGHGNDGLVEITSKRSHGHIEVTTHNQYAVVDKGS